MEAMLTGMKVTARVGGPWKCKGREREEGEEGKTRKREMKRCRKHGG